MGSAVIGALRVDLGMETAAFTKGAKHAEGVLSKLHETFKEYALKFASAFAFEKIVESIHGSIEAMDALGKTAQKIGVPVEELSKLSLAAKLTDTSMDTLASTTIKLSKNLELIESGKGGKAGAALSALGISATDASGKLKPTQQIIVELAEKFHGLKDGADKTAIALALMGKGGAEMIPFLNQGGKAIDEAAKMQEHFGLTTQAAADQAAKFEENIKTLKAAGEGLTAQVSIGVLPSLIALTNKFVDLVSKGDLAKFLVDSLNSLLSDMNKLVLESYHEWNSIGILWTALMDALDAKNPEQRYQIFHKAFADIAADAENTQKKIADFEANVALLRTPGPDLEAKKNAPHFSGDDTVNHIHKIKKAIDELAQEAKRVFESTRTPLEKYNAELVRLNILLHTINQSTHKSYISQEEYNRAVGDSFDKYVHAAAGLQHFEAELEKSNPILDQLKTSTSGWVDQFVDGTFTIGNAITSLLKDFEKMALNSVFQQLFNGSSGNSFYGGGGIGGIFGGLFKGLFGFADGGTIMPGGSGGIDSQIVSFRKSPGERVDIGTPNQLDGMRNGGRSESTVHVVLHPTDEFHASVDRKVNNGMRQAVQVSVAESGKQSKRSFGGNLRETQMRQG